jgi:hypothetical protein
MERQGDWGAVTYSNSPKSITTLASSCLSCPNRKVRFLVLVRRILLEFFQSNFNRFLQLRITTGGDTGGHLLNLDMRRHAYVFDNETIFGLRWRRSVP